MIFWLSFHIFYYILKSLAKLLQAHLHDVYLINQFSFLYSANLSHKSSQDTLQEKTFCPNLLGFGHFLMGKVGSLYCDFNNFVK